MSIPGAYLGIGAKTSIGCLEQGIRGTVPQKLQAVIWFMNYHLRLRVHSIDFLKGLKCICMIEAGGVNYRWCVIMTRVSYCFSAFYVMFHDKGISNE